MIGKEATLFVFYKEATNISKAEVLPFVEQRETTPGLKMESRNTVE